MGIDYYTCAACGTAFPDCDTDGASCAGCGSDFCSQWCVGVPPVDEEDGEVFQTCLRCTRDPDLRRFTDRETLDEALRQLGRTREDMWRILRTTLAGNGEGDEPPSKRQCR